MIKLNPDPTFETLVKITVPGHPAPVEVPMTFRHMPTDERVEWLKASAEKKMVDALPEIIVDWKGVMGDDGQVVPYSKEALNTLLNNYPAAATEILRAWGAELLESRIKN